MSESLKILIVDDEPAIRTTLKDILGIYGYEVRVAENGKQALEFVQEMKFGIILMDLKMPGQNGVETFRQIRQIDRDVKCLFMTGYDHDDEDIVNEVMVEGVIGICQKPLDITKLLGYLKTEASGS